jgi:hypothetical protein
MQIVQEPAVKECLIVLDVERLHWFHVETMGINRTRYGMKRKNTRSKERCRSRRITQELTGFKSRGKV